MDSPSNSSKLTLRGLLRSVVSGNFHKRASPSRPGQVKPQAKAKAALTAPDPDGFQRFEQFEDGGEFATELRGMVDRSFLQTSKFKEQQHRADRTLAQPEILAFEAKFLRRLTKLGIPMFTHACVRGADEQDGLFVRGHSKARAGQSPHNYGAAIDVIHSLKGWNLTRKQWDLLGHVGKETAKSMGLKLVWGGDWSFYDPAHWELENWREIRDDYRKQGRVYGT